MVRIFILMLALVATTAPSRADEDVRVPAAMQRCAAEDECTLIATSCADTCAQMPVSKTHMQTLGAMYAERCGKPLGEGVACTTNPPLNPSCISGRCTIGYAHREVGSAEDYKSGAYPVPEAPIPYQGTQSDLPIDDTDGSFTAYDLPQDEVKQNVMGQYTVQ